MTHNGFRDKGKIRKSPGSRNGSSRCLGGRSQKEGDDVEGKDHEDKNLEYEAVVAEPNGIKEDS